MKKINIYLIFLGNAEEAFNFYKSVFGGEFNMIQKFKDAKGLPNADKLSEKDKEKIMHISLPVGKGNILMASDAIESMGPKLQQGNNFYISITADTKEEANKLFNALSKEGQIEMPLADAFWGSYFGMFKDKFGIQWMISYEYAKEK